MYIKEVHEILQKLTNGKVTQNDIANAIGTSRANVSKLFSKNSVLNSDKINKIEEYFNVSLDPSSNSVNVSYYPETVGKIEDGKMVFSDKVVRCKMPQTLFAANKNEKYIMCHANDDSMYPLIWENDIVIVNCSCEKEILNNKIYAFFYENQFYIKRLANNINQIVVKSENSGYPVQYIDKTDNSKLQIIGKVIYIGKSTL